LEGIYNQGGRTSELRNGDIGKADIFVMNADGSNKRQLTDDPEDDLDPTWSPDGSKIAFTSFRIRNFEGIYVMDADGANQTRLTPVSERAASPAWSGCTAP
jgi:Tol biopolymer transport system component